MLSSRSRILANLNSKENMSPNRKRSSEEAFSSSTAENASKRRTVDSFDLPQVKSKSLFSSKTSNKPSVRKQMSIKSYYKDGMKENRPNKPTKVKIFNESKEETKKKPKEDDAFSLMCAEEAPEKYWELLAEERRKGLEIALTENKELADEIRAKDETIEELQTEVSELKETAKHAEYLASVLEELGKECNISLPHTDQENDSDSDSNSENEEDEVFDEKDISASYPEESAGSESLDEDITVSDHVATPGDQSNLNKSEPEASTSQKDLAPEGAGDKTSKPESTITAVSDTEANAQRDTEEQNC